MDAPDRYLTTADLAALLGVGNQTIRLWRMKGGGPPYIRFGKSPTGRVVYRDADVRAWLDSHRYTSTSEESARHDGRPRRNP